MKPPPAPYLLISDLDGTLLGDEKALRRFHEVYVSECSDRVGLIYSSRRDLDILPEGVDKGTAAEFIAHHLGYENSRVITAGNSGNDLTLMAHGFHGIVVANAPTELRERTRDNPRIYFSPREFAAGVEDGLRHWLNRLEPDHD